MKNPMLSVWLSAANAWAGPMRGFWAAELQRQQTAMLNEMMQQSLRFWSGAWLLPASPPAPPKLAVVPLLAKTRASRR